MQPVRRGPGGGYFGHRHILEPRLHIILIELYPIPQRPRLRHIRLTFEEFSRGKEAFFVPSLDIRPASHLDLSRSFADVLWVV